MPLRSATADTVAPGSSASVRTLTFCSAVQRLRRSTREMISPTLSIGVLTHVFKDSNAHDLRQHNKGSSGLTLTLRHCQVTALLRLGATEDLGQVQSSNSVHLQVRSTTT